jgi:hypothetical protein
MYAAPKFAELQHVGGNDEIPTQHVQVMCMCLVDSKLVLLDRDAHELSWFRFTNHRRPRKLLGQVHGQRHT